MTPHRAANWALAILIALAMSSAYLLDGPTDIEAARDTAADVQDAQAAAQRVAAAERHTNHYQQAKP